MHDYLVAVQFSKTDGGLCAYYVYDKCCNRGVGPIFFTPEVAKEYMDKLIQREECEPCRT